MVKVYGRRRGRMILRDGLALLKRMGAARALMLIWLLVVYVGCRQPGKRCMCCRTWSRGRRRSRRSWLVC